MLGDDSVGKSSLLTRYVEGSFRLDTLSTIGVDFKSKDVGVGNMRVRLQIWDTSGQQRYMSITKVSTETGAAYAKENSMMYVETSALEGTNVSSAFHPLAHAVCADIESGRVGDGVFTPYLEHSDSEGGAVHVEAAREERVSRCF
ncbi:small GTPase superfamily, Rho type [Kipferlia bialata]|uniref:Small GTPase superfamily, Rho type n=1 Tax=Kipferlia bialata TaxID=797122 RepID=A0A9K3CTL3_9EUKA|nr:small GTPase superfamily, Rho type [Kipferlia bialata]|eukprot:g3547.t1